MIADVQIVHSADEAELWRVTVNGQYLVGFYGLGARAEAERHRAELMEMLADDRWNGSMSPEHHEPCSWTSVSRSDRDPLVH